MRQQMVYSYNSRTGKSVGSAGVRLQVCQLGQFPKLGGDVPFEVIAVKESVDTRTAHEAKMPSGAYYSPPCTHDRKREKGDEVSGGDLL